MNLSDIDKGTYVAVKFTNDTLDRIVAVQESLRLLNPVKREDLHTTICYSRVYVPYIPNETESFIGDLNHLEIWQTEDGPALVLCLDDAEELTYRHNVLMALGATYDFPDYKPHITLSYNIGPQYINTDVSPNIKVVVSHEYVEDLDLDWAKDKK